MRWIPLLSLSLLVACGGEEEGTAPTPDEPVAPEAAAGHRIVATGTLSCAIGEGGQVACWGALPTGPSAPAVVPELQGAVELAASGPSVCSRDAEGGVRCWGPVLERLLGADHPTDRPAEIPGMRGATGLALSGRDICGIFDGGVRCSLGSEEAEIRAVGVDHATRLVSGLRVICAERSDAAVACVDVSAQEPRWFDIPESEGASVELNHDGLPCALASGQLRCLLRFPEGEAPPIVSAPVDQDEPRRRNADTWCSLHDDGAFRCGRNLSRPGGYELEIANVRDFDLGDEVGCALKRDGAVACFGRNGLGQSGPLPPGPEEATQVLGIAGVTAVASAQELTCAVANERRVYCWADRAGWLRPRQIEGVPPLDSLVSVPGGVCGPAVGGGGVRCVCQDARTGEPRLTTPPDLDASRGIGTALQGVVARGADGVVRLARPCDGGARSSEATVLPLRGDGPIFGDYRVACVLSDGRLTCVDAAGHAPEAGSAPTFLTRERGITAAAFTAGQACIAKEDGVQCLGQAGGLSAAPGLHPVPEIPADAEGMAMSTETTCFWRHGEAARCGHAGELSEPIGPVGLQGLTAGEHQVCAWTGSGEAWCWGGPPRGNGHGSVVDPPAVLPMPWNG